MNARIANIMYGGKKSQYGEKTIWIVAQANLLV